MKIAIGTAQFGLDYGISNKLGKTSLEEVQKILNYADNNGIKIIDTAYLYGNSEEVLGNNISDNKFQIVTKTIKTSDSDELADSFLTSLKRLRQNSIHGLLFHDSNDLINDDGSLWKKMNEFKDNGLVDKIGVSVYSTDEINIILQKNNIDIIQVPLNVFNQQLLKDGSLKKLKDKGVEIHVRSSFLQGLLLMNLTDIPEYFTPIKKHIEKYQNHLFLNNFSLLEGAIGFVKNIKEIDFIICGINNCNQLDEIMTAYKKDCKIDLSEFAVSDDKFINPALWEIN